MAVPKLNHSSSLFDRSRSCLVIESRYGQQVGNSRGLVSQKGRGQIEYFNFGHILAISSQVLMVYDIFNLYNLSSFLVSHQLVSQKCCSYLQYFWPYLNHFELDFDRVKSIVGLWFIQLIKSYQLLNPICQIQYQTWK